MRQLLISSYSCIMHHLLIDGQIDLPGNGISLHINSGISPSTKYLPTSSGSRGVLMSLSNARSHSSADAKRVAAAGSLEGPSVSARPAPLHRFLRKKRFCTRSYLDICLKKCNLMLSDAEVVFTYHVYEPHSYKQGNLGFDAQ